MSDRRLEGSVRIVGSGLLGASIGLGLTARGVDVIVDDASPSNARLAIDYGAGRAPRDDDAPALIVVCVPPDVTAQVVGAELAAHPDALVTDVASVKLAPCANSRAPAPTCRATSARTPWRDARSAVPPPRGPTSSSDARGCSPVTTPSATAVRRRSRT